MVTNSRSSITDEIPVHSPGSETLSEEILLEFLREASALPGRGPSATAIMLANQCRKLDRHEHILIMPKTLCHYGLTPITAYRALEQLSAKGLVTVHRKRGQGPTVSLLTRHSFELDSNESNSGQAVS